MFFIIFLLEVSVLVASVACFPKAILVNRKDLKRFQRAEKTVLYLSQIVSFNAEIFSLMKSIRISHRSDCQ